jgi:hypothetical protein
MVDWSAAGGTPGLYALRGTIPFVCPHNAHVFTHLHSAILTRYLQNGNILAAHTFITRFTTTLISRSNSLRSPSQPTALTIGSPDDPSGEVILTVDSVLNFCQLAVATCQRAQGDRNKAAREAWVRLCGTYQSKGGVLASPEVRMVRFSIPTYKTKKLMLWILIGIARVVTVILRHPATSRSGREPVRGHVILVIRGWTIWRR